MKKITPLVLLAFFTGTAFLQARPEFRSARRAPTPYDRYMGSVNSVLRSLDGRKPGFNEVARLLKKGYGFRYVYETPYVAPTPAQTEARGAGDCKAKTLWLADRMNDPSVRYVIGKARADSTISHAWLMWRYNDQWWVLDPTNSPNPIPANQVGAGEYTITYSYARDGSYRHSPAGGYAPVAGRRR